ncbi:MAG: hypothetical protein PHC61_16435, partial [Chitinivibrionales bacterium]|nr:hypothetical protein [Chitinivibrionales bacterium]
MSKKNDSIILENSSLKVHINQTTGAIEGIYNKKTKWQVIRQPRLSMGLQILVPLADQRNHKAQSPDQIVSHVKMLSNEACELSWDKIVGERSGPLDIKAVAKISLKGPGLTFELAVHNNSPYRLDEISYPCFGGMRPPKNAKTFRTRVLNMCGGFQNTNMLSPFPQARGYWGVNYPSFITEFPGPACMMPFELIELDDQGIYFGTYDDENNTTYFLHEFAPGFLDSKRNRIPETDEI